MQGVILAAGKGSRMGNIDVPKCLLEINEMPVIRHQINSFKKKWNRRHTSRNRLQIRNDS